MQVTERQVGAVTVLQIGGKLTLTDGLGLKDRLRSLVQRGRARIVLDLGGLVSMSSSGFGEVVAAHHLARKVVCKAELAGV
jgi:anti-anti-sigma factor